MKDKFHVNAQEKLVPYIYGGNKERKCKMPLTEEQFVEKYKKYAEALWENPRGFQVVQDRFGEEIFYMSLSEIQEKYGWEISNEVDDIMQSENFPLREQFTKGYNRMVELQNDEIDEYNKNVLEKRAEQDQRETNLQNEKFEGAKKMAEERHKNEEQLHNDAKESESSVLYGTKAKAIRDNIVKNIKEGNFKAKDILVEESINLAATLKQAHQKHGIWFKIFRPITYAREAYYLHDIKKEVVKISNAKTDIQDKNPNIKGITEEQYDNALNAAVEKLERNANELKAYKEKTETLDNVAFKFDDTLKEEKLFNEEHPYVELGAKDEPQSQFINTKENQKSSNKEIE